MFVTPQRLGRVIGLYLLADTPQRFIDVCLRSDFTAPRVNRGLFQHIRDCRSEERGSIFRLHLSSHAQLLNSNCVVELIVSEGNDYLWDGCSERNRNRAESTMVNDYRASREQLTE